MADAAATTPTNGDVKRSAKSRSQLKKLKKKAKKEAASGTDSESDAGVSTSESEMESDAEGEVQQMPPKRVAPSLVDQILADELADAPDDFKSVFERFRDEMDQDPSGQGDTTMPDKGEVIYSDEDGESEGSEAEAQAPSKRKQRKLNRLTVAELKRLVRRPEVVDWVDVSAPDPRLLVSIKSYRNVVPVPQHWAAKRDYLSAKRGLEKPPFQLPAYIADTGIATQRDAIKEKEQDASLKQKTRERVQPKMGKIDIDYQKLHDAFFKFQAPDESMTGFGEMYYEGKEFETDLRNKRPGELSRDLIEALSIPPLAPPPWLIAMQRFGPPPSYPSLRIPGLNAPIPKDAQWGFHPGGWGKPPVDEFMRPLYGDVFGVSQDEQQDGQLDYGAPVEREYWGEMEPDQEESEEEEEEEEDDEMDEDEDEGQQQDASGMQTPSGLATPSGYASTTSTMPGGMETPDFMDLRKQRQTRDETADQEDQGAPRDLYTVVPERRATASGFLGSDRAYDLSNAPQSSNMPVLGQEDSRKKKGGRSGADDVDLALDPAELEGMSEQELRQKYDSHRRSSSSQGAGGQQDKEDFSDFVAQEVAKKRQRAQQRGGSGRDRESSRSKEKFKF